jgi:hypothetical protein
MKAILRGPAVFASCALIAGFVAIGAGQAVASPGAAPVKCPDRYLCAYSEEQFFGEMSKVKDTNPDMRREADARVFWNRAESVVNNNRCKVHLYEKKNFKGDSVVLGSGKKIKDLQKKHPKLKHHIYSVKFEC